MQRDWEIPEYRLLGTLPHLINLDFQQIFSASNEYTEMNFYKIRSLYKFVTGVDVMKDNVSWDTVMGNDMEDEKD